jgi:hypothetical protein
MTPREIIAEAWAITRKEKLLLQWGCFSSFFETLLNLKLLSYQAYVVWAYTYGDGSAGMFDFEIMLYEKFPLWFFLTFIALLLILIVFEWFLPHLAQGAIIGLAAKAHKKEDVKGGLVLGLYNFFPIFEIHGFLVLSSWAMAITLCSMTFRYIDSEIKYPMMAAIVGFWVFFNIVKFLFSFAEPAVVIQKTGIFNAMGQSFKLMMSYLGEMMFLLILLFIITLRIVINSIIVLLIPSIMFGIGFLLLFFFSPVVSYSIAVTIGVVLVFVASYFFGYLHVFKETVWTITFLELKKHKELDVIE